MFGVYTLKSKLWVAVCGVLLLVVLVWSFVLMQSNKNIDRRSKRASYVLVLVVISILATIAIKLSN